MMRLAWDSGTRSAAEGTDLASVAKTLSDADLAFWIDHCRGVLFHETSVLEAEAERRKPDWNAGPLWR